MLMFLYVLRCPRQHRWDPELPENYTIPAWLEKRLSSCLRHPQHCLGAPSTICLSAALSVLHQGRLSVPDTIHVFQCLCISSAACLAAALSLRPQHCLSICGTVHASPVLSVGLQQRLSIPRAICAAREPSVCPWCSLCIPIVLLFCLAEGRRGGLWVFWAPSLIVHIYPFETVRSGTCQPELGRRRASPREASSVLLALCPEPDSLHPPSWVPYGESSADASQS